MNIVECIVLLAAASLLSMLAWLVARVATRPELFFVCP